MTVSAEQKPLVLAIFVLTYLGLAAGKIPGLKLNRAGIALLGSIAIAVVSRTSTSMALASVNWPTITLLFGFFVISAQLRLSGFYDRVAGTISAQLDSPREFLVFLIGMSAVLSAFLNNDIVCFVLVPVVGAALIKKGINPTPYLIIIAVSSNIGAGATLIGNAQNMMIGQLAGLSFLHYMAWSSVPVIVGLCSAYAVTRMSYVASPPQLQESEIEEAAPVTYAYDPYHATKGLVVLGAVIALFFTSLPRELVVIVAAGIHLLSHKYRTQDLLALVDWQVLLLFIALFVISGAFQATGYETTLISWLQARGLDPASPATEIGLTAGLTAVIGNTPAVMLLVKLVPITNATVACVLGVANSFGGNLLATASVANIIVLQQARRLGVVISFVDFLKLGIPITILALLGLAAWTFLIGHLMPA